MTLNTFFSWEDVIDSLTELLVPKYFDSYEDIDEESDKKRIFTKNGRADLRLDFSGSYQYKLMHNNAQPSAAAPAWDANSGQTVYSTQYGTAICETGNVVFVCQNSNSPASSSVTFVKNSNGAVSMIYGGGVKANIAYKIGEYNTSTSITPSAITPLSDGRGVAEDICLVPCVLRPGYPDAQYIENVYYFATFPWGSSAASSMQMFKKIKCGNRTFIFLQSNFCVEDVAT